MSTLGPVLTSPSPEPAGEQNGPPPSWWEPWKNLGLLVCTVLGLVLSFATMFWVADVLPSFTDDLRRMIALVGLAGAAIYLMVRLEWRNRAGKPIIPGWWRRYGRWIAAAWIAGALAVIAVRAARRQARVRECRGYGTAMARIRRSRQLVDRLGEPIRPGWWISGDMDPLNKASAGERGWRLEFSVSGPKGSAKVRAVAHTHVERKLSESVIVTVDRTGERLELAGPWAKRVMID